MCYTSISCINHRFESETEDLESGKPLERQWDVLLLTLEEGC